MKVEKQVEIDCTPEHAFRVFTERIGEWWPMTGHSVSDEPDATVVLEARKGGRFYERAPDGTEHAWGRVLEVEHPSRIVMTWHPGRGEDTAQELELRFEPSGTGTRVLLEHRGFEVFGEEAEAKRDMYDGGWPEVVRRFGAAAAARV